MSAVIEGHKVKVGVFLLGPLDACSEDIINDERRGYQWSRTYVDNWGVFLCLSLVTIYTCESCTRLQIQG